MLIHQIFLVGRRLTNLQGMPVLIKASIFFALTFLVIYLFKKHRFWKLGALTASLSIFVCSLIYFKLYADNQRKITSNLTKDTYIVRLDVPPHHKAVVYLPLPTKSDFKNALKIISGKGAIKTIDTHYGKALEVHFSGKVYLKGTLEYNLKVEDQPVLTLFDNHTLQEIWNKERAGKQLTDKEAFTNFQNQVHLYKAYYHNFTDSLTSCSTSLVFRGNSVNQSQRLFFRSNLKQDWQKIALQEYTAYADDLGYYPDNVY